MTDYDLLKALTNWAPVEIAVVRPAPIEGAIEDLAEVARHLDGIDTVSLDIFDTLLRRDVDPPDRPKREAMQYLAAVLERQGRPVEPGRLMAWRDEAEAEARQKALGAGGDPECTLTEIFTELYAKLGIALELDPARSLPLADLVEYEVAAETGHLSAMPGAAALLARLKSLGLRVVLLSDMYLEEGHLRRILDHAGLLPAIDGLYMSSARRASKGSGRLFDQLISDGIIRPGTTLHVGDHPVSDVERPLSRGLRAVRFFAPAEIERRQRLRAAALGADLFGELAPLFQAAGRGSPDPAAGAAFRAGYEGLGPVFTLFAFEVLRRAMSGRYEELFFLARDGFIFQRLYDRLRAGLSFASKLALPAGRYIHVSRPVSKFAALRDFDSEIVSLARRVNPQAGIWSVMSTLGLDYADYAELIEDFVRQHGAPTDLALSGGLLGRLIAEPRLRAQLVRDRATVKGRLARYLRAEGFLAGGRRLAVDIGWNGSILKNVEDAFGAEPDFPELDVLFFGRLYGAETGRIRIEPGFAFDQRRDHPVESLINGCRELFEIAASAMEGSAIGYEEDADGTVRVRHGANTLGDADRQVVEQVQAGVLAWCDDFIRVHNRFQPNVTALRADAVIQAVRLLTGRRDEDLDVLSRLHVDLGWGSDARVSLRELLGYRATTLPGRPPPFDADRLRVTLAADGANPRNDRQRLFERVHELIERLKTIDRLVVYGVGTAASLLAPAFIERVSFFVDGNSGLHGRTFLGRPIQAPESVFDRPDHTILVTPIDRKAVLQRRLEPFAGTVLYLDDYL